MIIKNKTDKEITTGASDILTTIKFSTPLRDVSRIINTPRRSFPRALAFGLLGAVGAGVCIGYAVYIVGALYFFVALGEDVLGSMMMGGFTAAYVCLPVVPTAGYLVGSRYSIIDDKHYVITDIAQPITIKAGKTVQAYVFVDAEALC